jgi:hypothetical protein
VSDVPLSKEPKRVFYVQKAAVGNSDMGPVFLGPDYVRATAEEMRQHIYETVTREREAFTAAVDGTSGWMPFYDWFEREFGDE